MDVSSGVWASSSRSLTAQSRLLEHPAPGSLMSIDSRLLLVRGPVALPSQGSTPGDLINDLGLLAPACHLAS